MEEKFNKVGVQVVYSPYTKGTSSIFLLLKNKANA